MTTTKSRPRIAPGTVNYLTDLVRTRQAKPGQDATAALAELTKWLAKPTTSQKDASDMIDRVKKLPKRAASAVPPAGPAIGAGQFVAPPPARPYTPYPQVPDAVENSKYAILTELLTEVPPSWAKQEYLFFEVKKLKGKRVIRRMLGAPGKFTRNPIPSALAAELYGHLSDPQFAYTATKTFADIYSICGRCAAELTDDDSRERKFGLSCWNQMAAWRARAGL